MQRSILLVSLVVSTVVIIIRVVTKAVIRVVIRIRVVKHILVVTKAVIPVVTYRVTETYNKNPRQLMINLSLKIKCTPEFWTF